MAYREMWEIEVRHEGLNKYRHIRGTDKYVVEQKAAAQRLAWDEMWAKKQVAEQKKMEREAASRSKEEKKDLAISKSEEAQDAIVQLKQTLLHTLKVDDAIDWDSLRDNKQYPEKQPAKQKIGITPPEPNKSDSKYQPKLWIFDISLGEI